MFGLVEKGDKGMKILAVILMILTLSGCLHKTDSTPPPDLVYSKRMGYALVRLPRELTSKSIDSSFVDGSFERYCDSMFTTNGLQFVCLVGGGRAIFEPLMGVVK